MPETENLAELCLIVIDDDPEDQLFTRRCLKRLLPHATVETYSDGESGLERLCKIGDGGGNMADLIMIDQRMPGLNGSQVLSQVSSKGVADRVPIVLFSSAVPPSEVDEILAAGARAYVEKPIDPDRYQEVINDILREHLPGYRQ